MNETMTVREVLEATANALGQIRVPISMDEDIAEPIKGCIRNIWLCIEAMDKAGQKKAEKEKEDNERTEYEN